MWWQVVFPVSCLLFVGGMHINQDPLFGAPTGVSCIDYTNERLAKVLKEGWRSHRPLVRKFLIKRESPEPPAEFPVIKPSMSRRMDAFSIIDNLIPRGDYLVKEHAKLVNDINSLRQMVFITPFVDDNRDYDDSIFHEIIETSSATTAGLSSTRPYVSSTTRPSTTTKASSIPVILLGGASQRQVVKSQPISFTKPTVSLIGTTISPVKHPYPFVMHRKPVKICVTSLPPMPATLPPTKTLWERLIDYFIPKRSLGR